MTIIIIQDEPGLKQYIHSHADAPQIMDLSDNRQVRTLYRSSLVNPPGFTGVQKKKILDEYIETISELGALNQFSLSWLCHPISEKNDLVSGSLLEQLVKFLQFYSVYSSEKEKPWIFYVEDPDLRRSILSVLNEEKKDVRIMQPVQQKNLSFLGRLRSIFATVKTCLQYQFRFMISFCFGMGVDKNKTYTVLRTWFDLRSPALLRQSEDIYFGKFPAFLQSEGHDVLFFGACIDGFGSVSKNLKRNSALPVVLQRSCLHGFDYLRAHVFQRSLLRRIRMKSGLTVLDIDVDVVFRNYLKTKKKSPQILANYLAYRAVLKLKKKIDVSYFFHPFENYGWEKVSRMAINKNGRRTRTVSFQHAQIALSSTKYFLGKNERHPSLLPDRIVTLGEVTRNFLVNEKKYPEELVRVGCALRSQISYPKKSIRRRPITK